MAKAKKTNVNAVEVMDIGDLLVYGQNVLMCTSRFPMVRFEGKEGNTSKFWEIFISNNKDFTTRWGKVETEGQSQTKTWNTEDECVSEYDKLIKDKETKGYTRTSEEGSSFTYVFSNPKTPGRKVWISSFDLPHFVKKESASIKKKNTL